VKKHQTKYPNFLIIAYEDKLTNPDIIAKALKEGNFLIKDQPVFLKAFPADGQSK
jgi:hypothetical protein